MQKEKTKSPKVVAIVQARTGSTRLPNKVFEEISGKPMLFRVVDRVRSAKTVSEVVVATTTSPQDTAIETYCKTNSIASFRGSEQDVLDRFYGAAKQFGADIIVRITADCPLLDPEIVDRVVAEFEKGGNDYVSTVERYTFPDGLDTEVFSFKALECAWKEAKKSSEREHVTPYIRNTDKFKRKNIENEKDLSNKNYHWSVDSTSDLEFVRAVYSRLGKNFGLWDIVKLLETDPTLATINANQIVNEGYYKSVYQESGKTQPAKTKGVTHSLEWLERSKKIIPSACQTFSKGPTQHVVGVSPNFLVRGKGASVWDADGNEYIDYIQGLLSNILGYSNPEVNAAVEKQLRDGTNFSLNHTSEVELAERLTKIIPCAEMVRLGKNGSDATSGAVRAARAFTGKNRIAVCGYHGWQDWYIGSTARRAGVPEEVQSLTSSFVYNDLSSLKKLFDQHPREFAAVVMEPVNFTTPEPGFLQGVRDLTKKNGTLLIFDEMCTGFHLGLGGAQKRLGITPDMATFGKAMGNGFPISCIVGKRDVMQTFDDIFYSFTFAGEAVSIAAAMKVLDILEKTDAIAQMEAQGKRLQDGFNVMAKEAGLQDQLQCIGFPQWSLLKFKDTAGKDSFLVRSLFQQEAAKRGLLLLVTHNVCASHTAPVVDRTLAAYAGVFKTLSAWLKDAKPERFLEGKIVEPVFRVR